jgi:hypothetical protein
VYVDHPRPWLIEAAFDYLYSKSLIFCDMLAGKVMARPREGSGRKAACGQAPSANHRWTRFLTDSAGYDAGYVELDAVERGVVELEGAVAGAELDTAVEVVEVVATLVGVDEGVVITGVVVA